VIKNIHEKIAESNRLLNEDKKRATPAATVAAHKSSKQKRLTQGLDTFDGHRVVCAHFLLHARTSFTLFVVATCRYTDRLEHPMEHV
jgi:hypothetical protein